MFGADVFADRHGHPVRTAGGMIGLLCFVLAVLAAPIKSKMRLEAEKTIASAD